MACRPYNTGRCLLLRLFNCPNFGVHFKSVPMTMNIQSFWAKKEQHPLRMLLPAVLFKIALNYETSMALVTFCFCSAFGMVIVRMPSSTLAEIWSFTTSSGSV